MEKLPVTVVIIAKNEEKIIGRCLASVGWAGEVVVVDGQSTDRTVEIARAAGAKVVQHVFTGSFADDRNAGMQAAANDWVLQLDADDVVTPGFRSALADALAKKDDAVVYKFRRKNYFLGHAMDHGGFHHYIPNLVNRRFVTYGGDVHEVPVYTGREGVIEADVEHYPFETVSQFVQRQNRYTDIAARDIRKREGILPEKAVRKHMIGRSFKVFWKSYIKKEGYREGMYGLVFAILFALINFLKWAKYWELIREEGGAAAPARPHRP